MKLTLQSEMDFLVTVRTYTGAIKSVEVLNMPNEEAARAEAVGLTFGRVQSVKRLDGDNPPPVKKKRKERVQQVERELEPGETEIIITGYNNNPLAIFSSLDIW